MHSHAVETFQNVAGISLESVFVFATGLAAAAAAVVAAILTTKGASERLEKQLTEERKRVKDQLGHERYLAKRDEASKTVEEITRLVARTSANFDEIKRELTSEEDVDKEMFDRLEAQVELIREEISIVGVRFGGQSPLVASVVEVLTALLNGWQVLEEVEEKKPDWKERLESASAELRDAAGFFVNEARNALENY